MFKVLIADDEPSVIYGLQRQVDWESLNMELAGTALSGKEILSMLASKPAHILITDVSMPQMDGLTLIAKAKLLQPSLHCIIISAHDEFAYVKKALQLGVENYLLKPINGSELYDTLSQTMQNIMRDQVALSLGSPELTAFRSNILDRWVNGAIQDFELEERAELLQINLAASGYRVCALEICAPEVAAPAHHPYPAAASQLLDMCRRFLFHSFRGECFLDSKDRIIAILHGEALGNMQAEVRASLDEISKGAKVEGMRIFSAVGPISTAAADVSASYLSALFFLNYRFIDPSADFVFSDDFMNPQSKLLDEAHTILHKFKHALTEESIHQASLFAEKFMQLHAGHSFSRLHGEMIPVVLSLIQMIIAAGRVSEAMPAATLTQLADFAALSTVADLKSWLAQTITEAVKVIRERKKSLHLLVRLTLEQVTNKYDEELSLKILAASFHTSPAYLGKLFREETGQYFNDYLTQVRLQASRSLLRETNLKINEIILRIGIPNQSYFNRVFKKSYGVSPIDFRRQSLTQ